MPKFLRIAAIVYTAYLALSLLVITPALNFAPHWYLKDNYGRTLDTKWVLLNPFTLSLEVRGANLPEPDGAEFAGLDSLSVNLSLESLWQTGIVFDKLAVQGLFAHVHQLTEGSFNFDDLLVTSPTPEEEVSEDTGIFGVTVHELNLQARTLAYTDHARAKPVTSRWNNLAIAVEELSTVQEDGRPYTLEVYGDSGGKLHWEGTLSIPGSNSEGTLELTDLSLHKLWEVAEPWLTFELGQGQLSMQGSYRVNWADEVDYQISEGNITLSGMAITPKAGDTLPDTGVEMKVLSIQPVLLNGATQRVEIGDIGIDGLALSGWMDDERLSLQELFLGPSDPNAPQDPNEPAATTGDGGTTASTPAQEPPQAENDGWSVSLQQLAITNGAINWRSPFTEPALLAVQPIDARVGPVNWPLEGETALELSLTANSAAQINIDGSLALAEGAGSIGYQLQELPLDWFNPNLPAALKAKIIDGALGIEGTVRLAQFAPEQIDLSGAITNFAVQIEDSDVPISGWETVRFDGLSVDMVEHTLLMQKLAIDDYSGRLHIAEDGSINTSKVLKEELGDQAEDIAEDLTEDKPWTFSIPEISISDSKVDFMDQSLPIPFRTVIGELNGEVLGLGGAEPAKVDIEGSVDGYAPVMLKGTADPMAELPLLDLSLTFDGVDMALLSPYSSTYAGRKIDQGILNLDLTYALDNNQLKGNNKVRMDQLKLGDKVESDKAIDAPLELALAIMTDASGVIDITVPVSGNVDDPAFSIGGIVGKAILNIMTKAVTAPFSLLANLVGSEEDLQRITFSTGSAELGEANEAKLAKLADALQQRPKLDLTITGSLKPEADRERLQKNILKQALFEAGLPQAEIDGKGPEWDKAIAKRYRKLDIPSSENAEPTSREMYLAVASSVPISDEQMLQLAQERAIAVKTYLVNQAGVDAGRAVIGQTDLEDNNQFSGAELGIN